MDSGACTMAWVCRTPCVVEGGRSWEVRGRWQPQQKELAKESPVAHKYFLVTGPAYPGDQNLCYLETERMR